MSEDQHHHDALLETARSGLAQAHAGAVGMVAGDIRRGLQIAVAALREAAALPGARPLAGAVLRLDRALLELDEGRLVDMEAHVEQTRAELDR